jgi:hypothetical protein
MLPWNDLFTIKAIHDFSVLNYGAEPHFIENLSFNK